MTDHDALQTLAELAVAIAGFAGVAFMVGAQDQASDVRTWRVVNLLTVSFTVVIAAMAPLGLETLDVAPAHHARIGCGVLGMLGVLMLANVFQRYRRLDELDRTRIGRNAMGAATPLTLLLVLALLAAALGLLSPLERAIHYYGLLFFLVLAALQFIVSIVDTSG